MHPLDDLAERSGIDRAELAFLDDLDPRDAATLAAVYADAQRRHDESIAAALDRSLQVVPLPLRGPVKKVLRGGRR